MKTLLQKQRDFTMKFVFFFSSKELNVLKIQIDTLSSMILIIINVTSFEINCNNVLQFEAADLLVVHS